MLEVKIEDCLTFEKQLPVRDESHRARLPQSNTDSPRQLRLVVESLLAQLQ